MRAMPDSFLFILPEAGGIIGGDMFEAFLNKVLVKSLESI